MNKIILLLILIIVIFGCTSNPTRILPKRNIDLGLSPDTLNTNGNEVAPFIRMSQTECLDMYNFERSDWTSGKRDNQVKPALYFFKEIIGTDGDLIKSEQIKWLTNNLESVTFLNRNQGFVSISHPPDKNFSQGLNLLLFGSVGGTDIMEFGIENNRFVFRALPEPVNTIFWDSHPWVGQDSLCRMVMIWSSDRDNPYSVTKDLTNKQINRGNADLFYSFRIGKDKWTEPKKFNTDSKINTNEYNEVSPFVACQSVSPKLLFSTNRDGDYDIYIAELKIDYDKQQITVTGNAQQILKGNQYDFEKEYINTDANEMFPFIAFPYNSQTNIKEFYLSSDRNKREIPKNQRGDTLVVNKGNYDLYSFDYELECKMPPPPPPPPPAKIELHVKLIDKKGNPVILPVVKLSEQGTEKSQEKKDGNVKFVLEKDKDYIVTGGSELLNLDCNQRGDSIIQYYKGIKYIVNEPKIVKNERKLTYDTLENPKVITTYDTVYTTEYLPVESDYLLKQIRNTTKEKTDSIRENTITQTETVKDFRVVNCLPKEKLNNQTNQYTGEKIEIPVDYQGLIAEVKKEIITRHDEIQGGKVVKKSRTEIYYDTIPQIDTLSITVAGASVSSKKTSFGTISTKNLSGNLIIYDTVIVEPVYFVKPKCEVEFVDIKSEYNKNVPYYQTAFWRVNTTEGLKEHLEQFEIETYLGRANYIELHPNNRKYGVAHKDERDKRLEEYREYARQVDGNLKVMRNVLTDEFIPILEAVSKYQPETKLVVKLEAYSDIRDASICYYIGSPVSYTQGKIDAQGKIVLKTENISNMATLSNDNENLSKLRVYYGFQELFQKLKYNKKFADYLDKGLIFYPTQKFESDKERDVALDKAKIIILAEGKFFDNIYKENEKDYDQIRRLNLIIKLIQYQNERIIESPCCK